MPVDLGPVRAAEIGVDERPASTGDPSVVPRHPLVAQDQVVVDGAADRQAGPDIHVADRRPPDRGRAGGPSARRDRDREDHRRSGSSPGSPHQRVRAGPVLARRPQTAGDRIGEPGVHPDVGPLDGRVGEQVDARAIDERVVMRAREEQGRVGELGGERLLHLLEALEVGGVEVDDEPVRHERPVRCRQPLRLHRALDATLQLDRLESGPEQPSGRALEETFEEPLDGGQRRHGRWRTLPQGRRKPARARRRHGQVATPGPSASRAGTPVRGTPGPLRYTLLPCSGGQTALACPTRTRGTMTEILTESFCERCGSRYTFESAVPKDRLRRVKVLSRGLKTFVLDDKTSFDEALAAARSDTDREATSSQLEAFHKTFNFCMQCRQYTCPNCWNEAEGRCLTCAPRRAPGRRVAAAVPGPPAADRRRR